MGEDKIATAAVYKLYVIPWYKPGPVHVEETKFTIGFLVGRK